MIRPRTPRLSSLIAVGLVCLLAACAQAQSSVQPQPLSVSVYFGNNAVWQRDHVVQIRGLGTPGVKVSFASADLGEGVTSVKDDGTWTIQLPPKPAGGPYSYTLRSGKDQLIIRDVFLGDVFICSGQSNMEWPVAMTDDAPEALTKTDDKIHHLMVPHVSVADRRREPSAEAFWQTVYPGRTEGFTAIGYYFAEHLRRTYPELAIGIINVSWGGSRIEAWLPDATNGPGLIEASVVNRASWAKLRNKYPEAFDDPARRLPVTPDSPVGQPIELGSNWEGRGFPEIDGTMWYDRKVDLSDRQLAAGPVYLVLGPVDDSDSTYVNGQLVGSTLQLYNQTRRYAVPPGVLKPGTNRINIHVEDTGGGGGLTAPQDSIYLQTGIGRVALGRGWEIRPESLSYDTLGAANQIPQRIYNGMLATLQHVAAKGVLWYQGESNASSLADADAYAGQIRTLLATFRQLSGQADLPFVAVELPEFMAASEEPFQPYAFWPNVRQSTRAVLDLPATSTVVAFGYGNPDDIHPQNKRPVARLLAEEMQRLAYGTTDGPTNALATGVKQVGQTLVVTFAGTGSGFETTDGEAIRGFAVEDASGSWHHATAEAMDGGRIRVVGPAGNTYRAVAYAWSNNPDESNLSNGYGRRVGSFQLSTQE